MSVLRLTSHTYHSLQAALFHDDDKESAALLLCRESHDGNVYLGCNVVPAGTISSSSKHVIWSGGALSAAIDLAEEEALTVILCHSHPTGVLEFSSVDDESDRQTIPMLFEGWLGTDAPRKHGSLIMTPNGEMRARVYDRAVNVETIKRVSIVGDTMNIFDQSTSDSPSLANMPRAFSPEMTKFLSRLSVTVVGVSGTGSIVAEQLIRLGIGHLRLVDFDLVENKNLNRILNSTADDAEKGVLKSDMMAKAGERFGSMTQIESWPSSILDRETVLACAKSDLVFCCVDSLDAREMCDSLGAAFLVPVIDVGVIVLTRVDEAGRLQIADVLGRVDFVRPGGPSLQGRGVYSAESLRQEYLRRTAPEVHATEVAEGYIQGVPDQAPPVISINMKAASTAVLEMVARLCPFRHDGNADFARTILRMAEGEEEHFGESTFASEPHHLLARGDKEPLLNIPVLAKGV